MIHLDSSYENTNVEISMVHSNFYMNMSFQLDIPRMQSACLCSELYQLGNVFPLYFQESMSLTDKYK